MVLGFLSFWSLLNDTGCVSSHIRVEIVCLEMHCCWETPGDATSMCEEWGAGLGLLRLEVGDMPSVFKARPDMVLIGRLWSHQYYSRNSYKYTGEVGRKNE